MSFKDCINNAEQKNEISKEQADDARSLFDEVEQDLKNKNVAPDEASRIAAQQTFDALDRTAQLKKYRIIRQKTVTKELLKNLENFKGYFGESNFGLGMRAIFTHDPRAPYQSLEYIEKAIRGRIFSGLEDFLYKFRRGVFGQAKHKTDMEKIVRYIHRDKTPNEKFDQPTIDMGEALLNAFEYSRKLFNKYGGNIAKLKGGYFPTMYSQEKVRKYSLEEFKNDFGQEGVLDLDNMIDNKTGLPMNNLSLDLALGEMYEAIRTQGWSKLRYGQANYGSSLANSRMNHKFLKFKSIDKYIELQKKYGTGDLFDVALSHLTNMARDIAFLKVLGPNPNVTLSYLKSVVERNGQLTNKNFRTDIERATDYFNYLSGKTNSIVSPLFAATSATIRNIATSALLGTTSILAVTDINFQRITRKAVGLNRTGAGQILNDVIKLMSPLNKNERRKFATRLGFVSDSVLSVASGQARMTGEVTGPEFSRRLSHTVLNVSLLSPYTAAGRQAFGLEFSFTLTDAVNKSFDQLDKNLKDTLTRNGISASEWNVIRKTELHKDKYNNNEIEILRSEDIAARTDISEEMADDLATKFLGMIHEETEKAVPSSTAHSSTVFLGSSRPGTILGEVGRSMAYLKNFANTVIQTHLRYGMAQKTLMKKGEYLGGLVITSAFFAALAIQAKNILNGKDPQPMNNEKFWLQAIMTGGGLGIFADFMYQNTNRFGRDFGDTLAGVPIQFVSDVKKLTIDNIAAMLSEDQDPKFASDLLQFTRSYFPGSSLWYIRAAFERQVINQIDLLIDPIAAKRRFRRQEQNLKKNFGQEYWWKPGEAAPRRSPNYGNIIQQ